jgi:hypothetical protein
VQTTFLRGQCHKFLFCIKELRPAPISSRFYNLFTLFVCSIAYLNNIGEKESNFLSADFFDKCQINANVQPFCGTVALMVRAKDQLSIKTTNLNVVFAGVL